jgi:hypothetical protein
MGHMNITKRNLESWLDPRLEVKSSSIEGKGMFARARIDADQVVVLWGGTLFTEAEIQAGKANPHSIAAIDEGIYLADPVDAPASADYFLNHSCDPNVWMKDEITLVARRTIEPGEELTADYALWENDSTWVLAPCRCGSSLCRKKITGNDWQLPELQNRYGNHFTPFINQRIQKQMQS